MSMYIVVRSKTKEKPCGMNGILHFTHSLKTALCRYNDAEVGKNDWNQMDLKYGVLLVKWDSNLQEYVTIKKKFVITKHP